MKKMLSLLLTLCLLLGALPTQVLAYVGDILLVDSGAVQQRTLSSGSLELRNDYLRVIVRKDGTLSTAPAADNGVTEGVGNGLFAPGNDCTRAQIVTFLWRTYIGK